MSNLKFRRVPWLNKEEWMEVYHLVNGPRDASSYAKAVDRMNIWIKSGCCPSAVEYTCKFLESIIKDSYYFELDSPENEPRLQIQYATSLLRFINILGEIECEKSLSLNARALKLGLPEWVVNTRHQISHGSELPSLDVLRVSVEALLNWLKVNYWEVEKIAMNDVVVADDRSLLEENMATLLNIFVYLSDVKTEFQSVRDVDDVLMKSHIRHINDLMFHSFKVKTCPWSAQVLTGHSLAMEPKKIMKLSINKAMLLVIRAVRVYLESERARALPVFVKSLLNHTNAKGMNPQIWESLVVWLHGKGGYSELLLHLFDELASDTSKFFDEARKWILFLLQCLNKRRKVDEKIKKLSSQVVSEPLSKKMKLSLTEKQQQYLIKERIKNQLSNEVDESKNDIVANVFTIIERQNPNLKSAYRLQKGEYPDDNNYFLMMTKVFLSHRSDIPSEIGRLVLGLSETMTKAKLLHLQRLAVVKKNRSLESNREILEVYDCSMLHRYVRA